MGTELQYRRDIDGLRAIAVAAVVLFHAGLPALSQGFLGVDVFFVISGFLISSQIFDLVDRGAFSLVGFYERRARRILPAALTVYGVTFAVALLIMPPGAIIATARSLMSAVLFVSNWFFLSDVAYFGFAAEYKPLLHTWSLSVEEQFYLLFPVTVMFLTRWKRVAIVAVAFLASLAVARYLSNAGRQDALFFSSPSRAWQPLLGVLAALIYRRVTVPAYASGWLRLTGLAVITFAIFREPTANHFREMLVPCVGAALVLLSRTGSDYLYKALSSVPFTVLGRLSYSLYLWHWPVLVFARMYFGTLTAGQAIACIALSLALSAASLHLVENPIRFRTIPLSRRQLFAGSGVATACLALLAAGTAFRDPATIPLPPAAVAIDNASRWNMTFYNCFEPPGDPDAARMAMARGDRLCSIGPEGAPRFIVWGDSHAYADLPAFADQGVPGLVAMYPGCPSLIKTVNVQLLPSRNCPDYFDAVLEIVKRRNIRTVIFDSRWSLYVIGEIGPGHSGVLQFADDQRREPDLAVVFKTSLENTIAALGDRKIVFIKEPPIQPFPVRETMMTNAILGRPAEHLDGLWTTLAAHRKRNFVIDRVFAEIARSHANVAIVDAADGICRGGQCPASRDGLPLYSDDDHLSHRGAPIVLGPILPRSQPY